MNTTAARRHEVLVLGAGYAGLSAAIQLAARTRKRGNVRVTVVNPYDRFTERLRLHMTATGQSTVAACSIWSVLGVLSWVGQLVGWGWWCGVCWR
ncbi:hypothetical protein AB0M94_00005, partial [Streptomyces xanthochromogenes]